MYKATINKIITILNYITVIALAMILIFTFPSQVISSANNYLNRQDIQNDNNETKKYEQQIIKYKYPIIYTIPTVCIFFYSMIDAGVTARQNDKSYLESLGTGLASSHPLTQGAGQLINGEEEKGTILFASGIFSYFFFEEYIGKKKKWLQGQIDIRKGYSKRKKPPSLKFYIIEMLGSIIIRYSLIDAGIVAVENGKSYSEACWTGAASIIPGLGQIINGENQKGALLLVSGGLVHYVMYKEGKRQGLYDRENNNDTDKGKISLDVIPDRNSLPMFYLTWTKRF